MKKAKYWKIVIAAIIGIGVTIFLVKFINKRPDDTREMIASIVSMVSWGGLAVFLVSSFLKDKDKEDSGVTEASITLNSTEDIEALGRKRNKILASVFLIELFLTLPTWITHNYTTSLTPENVRIIFDLIVHIPLVYFIYALYKGKAVLKYFFYLVIFATLGYIAVDFWEKNWLLVANDMLFGVYLIYYIKAAVNRRSFRLANFVILPLFFILSIVTGATQASEITPLLQKEVQLENEFSAITLDVNTKYATLIQEPDFQRYPFHVGSLKSALEAKNNKTKELLDTIQKLDILLKKDSMLEKKYKQLLTKLKKINEILLFHQNSDAKMEKMIAHIEGLDLQNVTKEQIDIYDSIIVEIVTAYKDIQVSSKELIELNK